MSEDIRLTIVLSLYQVVATVVESRSFRSTGTVVIRVSKNTSLEEIEVVLVVVLRNTRNHVYCIFSVSLSQECCECYLPQCIHCEIAASSQRGLFDVILLLCFPPISIFQYYASLDQFTRLAAKKKESSAED